MEKVKTIKVAPSRCIGCLNCELACASRDWDKYFPSGSKINLVFFKSGGQAPVTCLHCDDAPCLKVCRTGALIRDDLTKAIVVDGQRCIGCRTCVSVCPFGNIAYSSAASKAEKCDKCSGRPRCVAACPSGALTFVEEQEIAPTRRREFAKLLLEATKEP
ncbi:MAG: 4Fe-4S dicluster domain-containing protein [Deltaproteobacteria bacterium]|jgi:Fe-S-cluster-containing hydrogenase component 2|nr:4Fe-4S dicluster domain-containing protein [Deltaproteobacteria bacterium]